MFGVARRAVVAFGLSVALLLLPEVGHADDEPTPAPEPVSQRIVTAYTAKVGVSPQEATRRLTLQSSATGIVDALYGELGLSFGGVWFDHDDGRFHVAVTNTSTSTVRAVDRFLDDRELTNDTELHFVKRSYTELVDGASRLAERLANLTKDRQLLVASDVERNGVKVLLSDAADAAVRTAVQEAGAESNLPVRVVSTPPEALDIEPVPCGWPSCSRPLRGGVRINNATSGTLCTAGFDAYAPSVPGLPRYLLTAGHCTFHAGTWMAYRYGVGTVETIGPSHGMVLSGWGDAGTIRVNGQWDGVLNPMIVAWGFGGGIIDEGYGIHDRALSYVGLFGCRFGQTTPISCGAVTAMNIPVTYGPPYNVTVGLQTLTNACALMGDSGGPWMADHIAHGTTSASNQSCTGNPATQSMLYNEVVHAENLIGIRIITNVTGSI